MIIRNSITSILRTRKKTALFFLLILLLSIFLGMGVSVWAVNRAMMAECDRQYQTIGVISYMGSGYPDETYLAAETLSALESVSAQKVEGSRGVLAYEPCRKSLGYIEGYRKTSGEIPYSDQCILTIKNCYETSVFESDYASTMDYMAEVEQQVYTYKGKSKLLVHLSTEDAGFQPEYDKQYLVYGTWVSDALVMSGFSEIEDVGFLQDPENDTVKQARFYEVANNTVKVQMTANPERLSVFHQGQTELLEGDFYSVDVDAKQTAGTEEGKENRKVCLVTEDIALGLGLTVGDSLPIAMIPVSVGNIYESYEPGEDYVRDSYEIAGIIKNTSEYNHQIYIPPRSDIAGTYGFQVGEVLLENGTGEQFIEDMQPHLPDRMKIDVYDQGYTQIMDSMKSLHQTTLIILCICMAASLAVLVLFGYLFVFKQRDTVIIMRNLGTERVKRYTYLMVSSGAIAVTASFLGAVFGFGASSYVMRRVLAFLESGIGTGIDTRFSYLAEGLVKEYGQSTQVPAGYFLLTALALTIGTVLICLGFAVGSLKPPKVKKKKVKHLPRRERRSSSLSGVVFRHSWLSIQRGGMRTFVVCLVSGVLMLVFCVLTYTGDHYQNQRQQLQENTTIEGYFTNMTGKRVKNLNISPEYLARLQDSGYIEHVRKTLYREYYHYYFLGIPIHADGRVETVEPMSLPDPQEQLFTWEKLQAETLKQPCLLFTNDISAVGEFFYSEHPNITYMEGYDSFIFQTDAGSPDSAGPCLISEKTMKERKVSLGDIIRVGIAYGSHPLDYKVVGYYSGEGNTEHILMPFYKEQFMGEVPYDTVRFTLKDTGELTQFKDYLKEAGFSQVKERREISNVIVLKDTQYQKTIQQLDEKIKYMNLLYPVLYVLTGLISFLVSYLMMHNRKGELALMQSLGTPRWKVFLAFFLEQGILSLAGILVVWLLWGVAAGFLGTQVVCMAVCICCYLAGCALSVGILNRSRVLELLQDKE